MAKIKHKHHVKQPRKGAAKRKGTGKSRNPHTTPG